MSAHNAKYNLTLNYAKIRNTQKKNKSSIDMEKEAIDDQQINSPDQIAKIQKEMETKLNNSFVNLNENKSMLYYNTTRETNKNENAINNIFDDNKFNRENLEYINTLLKAKEVEKEKSPHLPINQYNIKISSSNINMNNLSNSNHKKNSTSIDQPIDRNNKILNDKFNNSVDNPISKNWNPFAKKTNKEDDDVKEKKSENSQKIQEVKEKEVENKENSIKRERIKSLFEQNNKKNIEKNEKTFNNSLVHNHRDSSYSFRTKKEEDAKNDPNFLNFIEYYIDYFNNNSYQHEKNEFSKEPKSKEINELKNENLFLKQQIEKYEFKFKEISSTKKNIHNEVSTFKKREEENQNIIRYQAQEINKLKTYISNVHFKLKYTQEALAREKIEAENSMIALKKVLYKKMKDSDFESQISNLVQNHIPTKDKYSRSKEKTSRGNKYANVFKDNEKDMNNFYHQETTESYFDKSMEESSVKSSISQDEIFPEQFNTPYMKEKSRDYSNANYALHRKRKSANFNNEIITNKNQINRTQAKKKNISQMEEASWKDQIMKKDASYLNKVFKPNEFENIDDSSMNENQNASLSVVNSD